MLNKNHKYKSKSFGVSENLITDEMVQRGFLGVLALGDVGLVAWRNKRNKKNEK